jgi:hypothetical protein
VSTEYIPEKAKLRFDRLEDRSGINWKEGYDPNGVVKKDGWHGAFDENGTWVRVEEEKPGAAAGSAGFPVIEVLKDGDTAILYDPGMSLLTAGELVYLTGAGEPYGKEELDPGKTVARIEDELKALGVQEIGAIGGMKAGTPETLERYKTLLGKSASKALGMVDMKKVEALRKEKREQEEARKMEKEGVSLYRTIRIAEEKGAGKEGIERALSGGVITAPLLPAARRKDAQALGLNKEETEVIAGYRPKDEERYNAVLSNMYANWEAYEAGGVSKGDLARLAAETMGGRTAGELATAVSLGSIIEGPGPAAMGSPVQLSRTGIPGVFREPEPVDFYNGEARSGYLKNLEKRRVLPKGGAEAAEGLDFTPLGRHR